MSAAHDTSQQPTIVLSKRQALIRVTSNNSPIVSEYQINKYRTSIGRNPNCDIPIHENLVSEYHFQIERHDGLYYLMHPHPARAIWGTRNGFLYQGKQYTGRDSFNEPLKHGDVFRISNVNGTMISITFDDGSGNIENVPFKDIYLRKDTISLGRALDNDVHLDHETVSSHHARLEKYGSGYRIIDLQSTNHIYVNNKRATSYDLRQGDEIRIGAFKLTYDENVLRYNENRHIRIEAKDLRKVVRNKGKEKVLLDDISLVIPPRSFVALVGGSGAGKSTLMRALNGFSPVSGTVYYNGQDYSQSYAAFSTQIGYVPQDDIVHRELTVQSALYYGAKLRLPSDYSKAQIQTRIKEVLENVELAEKKDIVINKLSGGQRKRVSIALELLANPSILFLDEPTSGLDPGLESKMMNLLRKLADKGQTIVLVTHTTNNINVCDYVCFMGAGRLIYFGPPYQATQFFHKTDFADIYNELDTEQKCKAWSEEFRNPKYPYYKTYISDPLQAVSGKPFQKRPTVSKPPKRNHPLCQWALLCRRYIDLLIKDRGNLAILLLQAPVIALLIISFIEPGVFDPNKVVQCPRTAQVFTPIGLPDLPSPSYPAVSTDCNQLKKILQTMPQGQAYAAHLGGVEAALQNFIATGSSNTLTILFTMAFAAFMCGCVNSSREIVKEGPIYRRERAVNVGILPYLFSKLAVLGILCLFQSAILVGVVSIRDPFLHGTFLPGWLEVYITITLTALAGLTLGLTVSAIVPNSDRATSFLPLLLLPQFIFSGTLFPLDNQIIEIIGMASTVRWAMAALGSTVGLHGDRMIFGPGKVDKLFGNSYSYHGTLFSTYSLTNATWHLIYIWLALLATIVTFTILTLVTLRSKDRRT